MNASDERLSRVCSLAISLTCGASMLAAGAHAKEILPLTPKPQVAMPGSRSASAAPETFGARVVEKIPFRTPVSPAEFRQMKTEAATNPSAQAATELARSLGGPVPLNSDVTLSFAGLNQVTSASLGSEWVPPDTIIARGPASFLEATNSAARLFNGGGGVLATSTLNTFFFSTGTGGIVFDPKVYFDRNSANPRFVAVALQVNFSTRESNVLLNISRSPAPANLLGASWCQYRLSGRFFGGTVNDSWADYPGLGAGADALLITHNNFGFSGGYKTAFIRALRKTVAYNNAAVCPGIPFFDFQAGAIGDTATFTLQPVQHYTSPSSFAGTTNPAYLMSTVFGANNRYRIWQLRNVATSPTGRVVDVVGNFVYGVPPDAPQTGSAVALDTGDNRLTQAGGQGNSLHGVHATLCQLGGGNPESCARYVNVIAGQSSAGTLTAAISQQRTFGFPSEFYFWPGVAVNGSGQVAVPFQFVSPALTGGKLSAWWAMKDWNSTFFSSMLPITQGTCAQTFNRTGDYTGAQTNPDNRSFTLAGERATTLVANGTCKWQTQIINVLPGAVVSDF